MSFERRIYYIRPSSPRPCMRPDRVGRYVHDSCFLRGEIDCVAFEGNEDSLFYKSQQRSDTVFP